MAKRMLIDATHPEETRVVVISGNRLEEFDFETSTKKLIKGNIYLAKVTRVEPSLQAAFVDYGGNRHGFLAFSEIHPDYYRLPVADREALMAAAAADHDVARIHSDEPAPRAERADRQNAANDHPSGRDEVEPAAPETIEPAERRDTDLDPDMERREARLEDRLFASEPEPLPEQSNMEPAAHPYDASAEPTAEPAAPAGDEPQPESSVEAPPAGAEGEPSTTTDADRAEADAASNAESTSESGKTAPAGDQRMPETVGEAAPPSQPETISTIGGDEAEDEAEVRRPSRNFYRRYRIQEVVARRQIMLVQVQKEERGNKGAALTTYISLAGRYCVLMPNTPRGGGVSRKITSQQDRKRLKSLIEDLEIPDGMAVIVRTAGMERTKAEIKRDYEYLVKLWDDIRERTMSSTAPALIYEEASLIKRAIRDVYSKEIDEILVEGDEGYKAAKGFMKLLMPSHAKRVQEYTGEGIPLFHRYQIETQLDSIHSPSVQLRSGGYIVMNSTEALVAVDVNSGRATRERNIEETAYRTNLEAADEIARQLRLRDLAGLIVIDFIDMEEHRNKANVERRLKDALRQDRARIQVGRISAFGLLEMSRQRLRPSLFESSTQVCHACGGTGFIRSTESTALHVMRAIEEEGMRRRSAELTVHVPSTIALYMLNQKRQNLAEIERRYDFNVIVATDDKLIPPAHRIERAALRGEPGQLVHALPHADVARDDAPRHDTSRGESSRGDSSRSDSSRTDTQRGDAPRQDHERGDRPRHEHGRRERHRHDDRRPDGQRHEGQRPEGQRPEGQRHEGQRPDRNEGQRPEGRRPEGEPEGQQPESQRHDGQRHENRQDSQRSELARDDESTQPGQPQGERDGGRRRRRRRRRGRSGDYDNNQQRGPSAQPDQNQADQQRHAQPTHDAGETQPAHDRDPSPSAAQAALFEPAPRPSTHDAMTASAPLNADDPTAVLSESQDEHMRADIEQRDSDQRDGRRRRRGRRGGRRRRRGREDGAPDAAPADASLADPGTNPGTDSANDRDFDSDTGPSDTQNANGDAANAPDFDPPARRDAPRNAAPGRIEPTRSEPTRSEPVAQRSNERPHADTPPPAPERPVEPTRVAPTPTPVPPAVVPPAVVPPTPSAAEDPSRPKRAGWWQRLIE